MINEPPRLKANMGEYNYRLFAYMSDSTDFARGILF